MTCEALRFCLLAMILSGPVLAISTEEFETVKTSNAAILNRLGLVQILQPDGHHRKRLAGPEAFGARDGIRVHPAAYGRRHSGSPHDSHVYVVKLPASPPYYSFSKPHKHSESNVTVANPNPGFRNNGKPAKIYHWNLPLVKKINEKKKQLAVQKLEQARKKMEADRERQKVEDKMNYLKKLAQEQLTVEAPNKPSRNNDKWLSHPEHAETRIFSTANITQVKILPSVPKPNGDRVFLVENDRNHQQQQISRNTPGHHRYNNWHESSGNDVPGSRNALDAGTRTKPHKKKSTISYYYAPALTGKSISTSISKHFSGNGKPKAFYVMEKSRKPVYYHPLLP